VTARAFTLIETLAAAALLGLVGSVAIIGLAGAGGRARITEASTAVRDLDQRARELAVNEGPVTLLFDEEARQLSVRGRAPSRAVLAQRSLPIPVELILTDAHGRAVEAVSFDRLGRSPDYGAEITASGAAVTFRVSGRTGWIEEAS